MKKIFWLLPLAAAIPLFAVTPLFWETRSYDDFRKGKLANVSLTSDDELILAPRLDMVFNTEQTLVWSTVADSKGNVYLGTGHDGKIFKVDSSGKGSMVADLSELDVLALAVDSKDVLYAVLYLAALIAYVKYLGRGRVAWLGVCLASFVLSLASKPAAVVLPVTLLAIDFYRKRPFTPRVMMEKLPFVALSVIEYCAPAAGCVPE